MKTRIITLCLITYALLLYSCGSGKNENSENRSVSGNPVPADTSINGITGVIEKASPVKNGDYIVKYPSGITKMKGFYIKGKREGQWTSFFENGKIQSEGFFKNGLRDGKAIVYFENGRIYYEGFYKDGKEIGKWIFYDEGGNKINEKDYGNKPNS